MPCLARSALRLPVDSEPPLRPLPIPVPYFHPAREFKLDINEFVYSFDKGRLKMRWIPVGYDYNASGTTFQH